MNIMGVPKTPVWQGFRAKQVILNSVLGKAFKNKVRLRASSLPAFLTPLTAQKLGFAEFSNEYLDGEPVT
jgi:hypothetical protein